MSVIWLKLWQHVWQSLKPLVKDFGSSSTECTMEVLEELNLLTPDAWILWRARAIGTRDLEDWKMPFYLKELDIVPRVAGLRSVRLCLADFALQRAWLWGRKSLISSCFGSSWKPRLMSCSFRPWSAVLKIKELKRLYSTANCRTTLWLVCGRPDVEKNLQNVRRNSKVRWFWDAKQPLKLWVTL